MIGFRADARAREVLEQRRANVRAVVAREDFGATVDRRERLGERRGVGNVNQAGREQRGDMFQLGEILALQ